MTSLIATFTRRVNDEVMQRRTPTASLCARLQGMDEVESARGPPLKKSFTQQDAADSREPVVLGRRPDKRCRRAEAYLDFVTNKEISKQHAQWREKEMQLLRNTPSSLRDGAIDVVSSAKAADACNRFSGQELSPDEERVHDKDVFAAKTRELDAWSQFKVYSSMKPGEVDKEAAGTRWVLTWTVVDGYQDPDLEDGLVKASGRVNMRSSHFQVVSLAALRAWRLWSLDVKNPFLQSDGFGRDVPA